MKKLLGLILLSSTLLTGCRREYAFVQPAQVDVFVQKQRVRSLPQSTNPELTLLETKEVKPVETAADKITLDAVTLVLENQSASIQKPVLDGGEKNVKQVPNRQNRILAEKPFLNLQAKEIQKRELKKKKKRPIKRWGTMIPTGFIFLGIAILLSIINLNGLALLFGVAAILFLFLGFRKLFRKKRRREIFR